MKKSNINQTYKRCVLCYIRFQCCHIYPCNNSLLLINGMNQYIQLFELNLKNTLFRDNQLKVFYFINQD